MLPLPPGEGWGEGLFLSYSPSIPGRGREGGFLISSQDVEDPPMAGQVPSSIHTAPN